jgi:hypothetical protein
MHPLVNDLSELSDNELEDKILKLNKAYFSSTEEVRHQIILLLDTYKLEVESRRTRKTIQNQEEDDNNPLDNLINVS